MSRILNGGYVSHKSTVEQLIDCFRTNDMSAWRDHLHDNYNGEDFKEMIRFSEADSTSDFSFSYIKFLELLRFPPELVDKAAHLINFKNKDELVTYFEFYAQIHDKIEILSIIEEGDELWVQADSYLNPGTGEPIVVNGYYRIWFKDNKVIQILYMGRYLRTILNYGSIIFKNNDQQAIAAYMQTLREMKLIPSI